MENMITHNFSINSLLEEKVEDKSIIKFKSLVHTFDKSKNGWAMSMAECEKSLHTLIGKHIVTRYYDESVNGGQDALGDHEESSTTLRETNGEVEIPTTNTSSIGTIMNAYIDTMEDGRKALFCEGQLHYWDNLNSVSLIHDWAKNGVKINVSVEWYFSNSAIGDDGTLWVGGVTYSNLCILNSEDRGYKEVVLGNYSDAHIELLLNNINNDNDVENISNNTEKEGEIVEDIKQEDVVIEPVETEIPEVVEEEKVEEVVETPEVEEVVEPEVVEEIPTVDEVPVEEPVIEEEVKDEPQVDLQAELVTAKENEVALNETIVTLNARIKELEGYEKELNQIKYDEKLANAKLDYQAKFTKHNAIETFESEEVQSLIVETLDGEKSLNARLKLAEVLLNCVDVIEPVVENKEVDIVVEGKSLNNLAPKEIDFLGQYGFKA